uniref:Uncharacterized protein n=1 Tax=Rhipicephalus zambeziensis TaxID=60191 RepID=A0A224YAB8_9ACAR
MDNLRRVGLFRTVEGCIVMGPSSEQWPDEWQRPVEWCAACFSKCFSWLRSCFLMQHVQAASYRLSVELPREILLPRLPRGSPICLLTSNLLTLYNVINTVPCLTTR